MYRRHPIYRCLEEEWWQAHADFSHLKAAIADKRWRLARAVRLVHQYNYPIDYLLGWKPFLGGKILTKPPVLIPRGETEECLRILSDGWLEKTKRPLRVLEIGSGTGCISLFLASQGHHVEGIDCSSRAISLARRNCHLWKNQIKGMVSFSMIDAFSANEMFERSVDLIISNPPYLRPSSACLGPAVRRWEDPKALYGGAEIYRRICQIAQSTGAAMLAVEIDGSRHQARLVTRIIQEFFKHDHLQVIQDSGGRPRAFFAWKNKFLASEYK